MAEFFHENFNTKETPEELVEIWHNKAYDAYKNTVKAKKGAKKLLSHLKDNNVKTAIVTSNSHELIEAGLKNNGLYDYIDLVITADSLNTNKDTPYIFQETARRLDVEPEYIIVFDDLYPVIKAVNDANMRSVAVYDKRSIKAYGEELIRETADYYIKDFTEVL
ncbi:MAG TPA: HAD family hydrolase [Lachnospiraceae bacterium]|nr:HAD family hydrolase [Lachnospiraceae bacterium]